MTTSIWQQVQLPAFKPLDKDLQVDVCIVGGGIAGLTSAYHLLKAGKSVAIIDKEALGKGQTSRTTAHLTWMLDDRYFDLEKIFGEEGAKLALESHAKAVDTIEKIVADEKIDCDFERLSGYLFLAPEDKPQVLEDEFNTIQKFGTEIKKHSSTPLGEAFKDVRCLEAPHQGECHIHKYLKGLIGAIVKMGGKIYTETKVIDVKDGTPCIVKIENDKQISSSAVIVATCTPINDRFYIHTKQAAYRTYVVAGLIPKNSAPKGIFWDTPDPYHYIRTLKDEQYPDQLWLLIGGEDHKVGQEKDCEQCFEILKSWANKHFPQLKEVQYHWSGQVFEPVDSLAFIGKNPGDSHIYICTGDSGNGITHGTIAGILIPDLILGRSNRWKELYEPSRKSLSTLKNYLEENSNAVWQFTDWLTPGEKKQIEDMQNEEGVIIRDGIHKIAVFKDAQGTVHFRSAFCPHLGGCVQWNNAEKSWDCPVHGSRFDGTGKSLVGPAVSNLSSCQNSAGCQPKP